MIHRRSTAAAGDIMLLIELWTLRAYRVERQPQAGFAR
jgi:hypothetical protein